MIDEAMCLEAIDNLISNAIKYSPESSTVKVSVDANEDDVSIIVEDEDEGQGFTTEDICRAFSPFQTLSAKPTGGEVATGMGLVSVRRIAEAHGGCVAVESEGKGRGPKLIFRLPRMVSDRFQMRLH